MYLEFSAAELRNLAALEDEIARRIKSNHPAMNNPGVYNAIVAADLRAETLRGIADELGG